MGWVVHKIYSADTDLHMEFVSASQLHESWTNGDNSLRQLQPQFHLPKYNNYQGLETAGALVSKEAISLN